VGGGEAKEKGEKESRKGKKCWACNRGRGGDSKRGKKSEGGGGREDVVKRCKSRADEGVRVRISCAGDSTVQLGVHGVRRHSTTGGVAVTTQEGTQKKATVMLPTAARKLIRGEGRGDNLAQSLWPHDQIKAEVMTEKTERRGKATGARVRVTERVTTLDKTLRGSIEEGKVKTKRRKGDTRGQGGDKVQGSL